jgi:hypothetical protein
MTRLISYLTFTIVGFVTPYMLYFLLAAGLSGRLLFSPLRSASVLGGEIIIPVCCIVAFVVAIYRRSHTWLAYAVGFTLGICSMVLIVLFWHPAGGF